jgi:hypothetical protein
MDTLWPVLGFVDMLVPCVLTDSYVDPGMGSQLIQFAIAGAVGLAFLVKMYWRRIVALGRRVLHREPRVRE